MRNLSMFSAKTGAVAVVGALVPDGVASVKLTYAHGAGQIVRVQANFWVTKLAGRASAPTSISWLSWSGRVVKVFPDDTLDASGSRSKRKSL